VAETNDHKPDESEGSSSDEPKKETKASPQSAITSLIGLIVIGAAVYYGLPHVSEALKKVITTQEAASSEEDLTTGTEDKAEEVRASFKQEEIEELAAEGIKEAIKGDKRESYQFIKAIQSKNAQKIRVTFEYERNTYDLTFEKNEEFDTFESRVEHPDLIEVFSRLEPSFESP